MTNAKLLTGWRVENLGLIAAVQFTGPDRTLTWCDGQWTIEHAGMVRTAPGVGKALTMKDARRIGSAFLAEVFA